MRSYLLSALVVMALITASAACTNDSDPNLELTSKPLHELYPGGMAGINRVEIRSGSTGKLKIIANQQQVQDWINKIHDIEMIPDPDQSGKVGFLYDVKLYEGSELTFRFGPSNINGDKYIHNEQLEHEIHDLFEQTEVK